MERTVHLAALRAAAKVAFATTVFLGCSAAAEDETESTTSNLADKKEEPTACTDQDAGTPNADASVDPIGLDAGAQLPCCWMIDFFNDGKEPTKPVACTNFGPGCTPWGPPVPPAMNRGVRGLAAAA